MAKRGSGAAVARREAAGWLRLSLWAILPVLAFPLQARTDCVAVIAHRGASGYLPEHTLAAYALGYAQGAQWIEPDVMLTADGIPIALHDLTLDRTTNVADVFPQRRREDGSHHAADFTLEEIRQLAVVERQPGRFPHAAFHPPRLDEVLALVDGLNRTIGRRVGVYPELKHPDLQPGVGEAVLDALAAYALPVRIQSFDLAALRALETVHPRVALISDAAELTPDRLDEVAAFAMAIGISANSLHDGANIVEPAHARGLEVHAFTLRADRLAPGYETLADEVAALAELGVDAVFTDHPDQVRTALAVLGRACAAE